MRHNRPSNFIIETVGPIAEWLIDKVFLSSALIAPAAAIGAVVSLLNGWPLLAAGCVLIAALAAVGIHARFVAPFKLTVKHLSRDDLGLEPMPQREPGQGDPRPLRIVFFSDLHAGEFKRQDWVQRVVELANAQSPDLVLIGGDFVGHTKCCDLSELLAPLKQLRAPLGVFGVFGNHDHGLPGPDHSQDLARILPGYGVRVMRNECAHLRAHLQDVQLIGVEEIWTQRADLQGALAQCADPCARTIVLGHNPDLLLSIQAEHAALNPGHTLFLFGHTHQGQIYIPFLPGLAVPIESKYYRGIHRTPYGSIYVSSGCGENTTPTRLNTQPEVVVIDL